LSYTKLFTDFIKKPPVYFPLIGLFHIIWLFVAIWDASQTGFNNYSAIQIGWMSGYTFFWLAACDLRKWGLWAYVFLALINTILFFNLKYMVERSLYTSSLRLFDVLFAILLLLHHKFFDK